MRYFVGDIMLLPNQGEAQIRNQIANRLRIPSNSFRFEWVNRRARLVDNRLCVFYDCAVDTFAFVRNTQIHFFEEMAPFQFPSFHGKGAICVIGAGFSGLFCAYLLAKHGAEVIVLEQGGNAANREKSYRDFREKQIFDPASNPSYGFGGFSALHGGYLQREIRTSQSQFVLDALVSLGLPESVKKEGFSFVSKDQVNSLCLAMERYITDRGGRVIYGAKALSVDRFLGWPKGVSFLLNGTRKSVKAVQVVVAGGNTPLGLETAAKCRVPLKNAAPRLGVFVEINGRDFETNYFGRGGMATLPPLYVEENVPSTEGRDTRIQFGYCNAPLTNVASVPFRVDLGLQLNSWSGAGNAIACVSTSLTEQEAEECSLPESYDFGGKLLSNSFSRLSPYAIPAEMMGDFLSKREPMLLGSVRPSYFGGVFLANLHKILPRSLAQSLLSGVFEMGRRYPLFASSRALVSGFSTMGSSRYLPLPISAGGRGVYALLPRDKEGQDLLKAALRAFETAARVLSDA